MKSGIFTALLIVVFAISIKAQQEQLIFGNRPEVTVTIDTTDLYKIPSIEAWAVNGISNGSVKVVIGKKQYSVLLNNNISFIPLKNENTVSSLPVMAHSVNEMTGWEAYPDYQTYLNLMKGFAEDYPNICQLDTIGYSVKGKLLLALKISNNTTAEKDEPKVFYTSSMHGDELSGYVLMLRLADYLLTTYSQPAKSTTNITNDVRLLIENTEVYINPLANPDGAFAVSDTSVADATRFNANSVDLNRNFPDPSGNQHPDGEEWQPETVAMMDYMQKKGFNLSMNFHDGEEVLNYPFDYTTDRHPDNDWFAYICRAYTDTVHSVEPNYMTHLNNGITNGADWYVINGGRQDYVTHYLHGREVTAELSNDKTPKADTLPYLWLYNYKSLIKYALQANYGIHGIVTDISGNLLDAKISIEGYDKDSSFIRTNNGVFFRYLPEGIYDITVEADGFAPKTVQNINVTNFETTNLSVVLDPMSAESMQSIAYKVYPNPATEFVNISLSKNSEVTITVYSLSGKTVNHVLFNKDYKNISIDVSNLLPGIYILKISDNNKTVNYKFIKQ